MLHELDVCVLTHAEAETSRRNHVPPQSRGLILAVECKFYQSHLALDLARSFIGLNSDLSGKESYFISSNESERVEALLTARKKNWDSKVVPRNVDRIDRVRFAIRDVFKKFKARW